MGPENVPKGGGQTHWNMNLWRKTNECIKSNNNKKQIWKNFPQKKDWYNKSVFGNTKILQKIERAAFCPVVTTPLRIALRSHRHTAMSTAVLSLLWSKGSPCHSDRAPGGRFGNRPGKRFPPPIPPWEVGQKKKLYYAGTHSPYSPPPKKADIFPLFLCAQPLDRCGSE